MKSICVFLALCAIGTYAQSTTEAATTTQDSTSTSTTTTTTSTTWWPSEYTTTESCACSSYVAGNYTNADGSGCMYCTELCSNNECTCGSKPYCDAWVNVAKALGAALIAVIVIAIVCGLGIIGCIIFCVFQCVRPRPKPQPYVAMGNQPV